MKSCGKMSSKRMSESFAENVENGSVCEVKKESDADGQFDESVKEISQAEVNSTRFKCVVAYDGTDYCGWQSQATKNSVQDFIERRLAAIFGKQIRIHSSGRTDAGVHAAAQVFHFDADWKYPLSGLEAALRSGYPDSIRILKISRVKKDFHARYGAKGKRYVYKIYEGYAPPVITRFRWSFGNRRLDVEAMNEAAKKLLGTHNFTAFSVSRGTDAKDNPIKSLRILNVSRRGKEVKIITEGSGYLYKMVRMLTGALVGVGTGKLSAAQLEAALKNAKRCNLFQAAPAEGLTLEKVFY